MSIASEILRIQQAKQAIKDSINDKGGTLTNETIDAYAQAIDNLPSGGGGVVDEYFYYSKAYYTITNNSTLFADAWTNSNKRTTLFDGTISLVFADGGMAIYSGDGIDELYDLLESGGVRKDEYLKITLDDTVYDATSIDSVMNTGVALRYVGGEGGIYEVYDEEENSFLMVLDSALFGMPYGKVIILNNENATYLKIESGFNHYYENGIIISDGVEIVPDNSYSGNTNVQVIDDYFEDNDFPLVIPNSVTHIGDSAFRNWLSNNQPLIIPNSVTEIGDYAFGYWEANNQRLIIPNSVTSIGNSAFSNWRENNQTLVIPDSVTSIGTSAFTNWTSNNQPLVIPDSFTSIGNSAFHVWSANNQPLTIPNSVTEIGDYAFASWRENNHPLVIPDSVTSIAYGAFSNWSANNQPLTIPNSVTSIGGFTFGYWEANNQPLVIPNSVTSIGAQAFFNWPLVPYVEMQSITPPTLANADAFNNQNDAPIYVPDESVDDYKTATNWVDLADRIFSINDK